jgi:hypothetical protein
MRSYKTLRKYALAGAHGKDWYALAELSIRRHCNSLGFDVQTYVDVLAITSPRVNVRKNVQLTNAYMTTRKRIRNAPRPGIGTATGPSFAPYLVHRQVAGLMTSIRSGLEHYELTGEIRGPKTSAFARALLGDGDAIVLDVWMARALDVEQATLATRKVREPCEDLVRKVARSLGWAPAQVQAAVWTHWYEDRGRVGTTTAVGVDTVLNTL